MMNLLSLSVNFTRPYLLLTFILFLALTIIPYFTLSKKYRKTRNRITSMVLHMIVSILVVLMLAGTTIVNSESNPSNELILAVDVSNTQEESAAERDQFIENVISQCKFEGIKIGIVTFGYDQIYAVPLTRDYKNIYKDYKNAELPDTSATNIAGALQYAKTLFTNEQEGKIVLVSDGKETDESAKSVIRSIVASGIIIDTAYIESSYTDTDVEVVGISMPDYHISKGEEISVSATIYSNTSNTMTFRLYDNGEYIAENDAIFDIKEGSQEIQIKHRFSNDGIHELKLEVLNNSDSIEFNDIYTSYYYLEYFNRILIIEQSEGQSDLLYKLLTDDNDYIVEVINLEVEDLPETALELCAYDEVILNNIANSDLPLGFDLVLREYVQDYGGGLFTAGGTDSAGDVHAYSRTDLVGTVLQQMLPVQAINYTPPVGVVVIIDRSGSMGAKDDSGNSLLDWARAGALSCLDALTERDYFAVMTFDSDYDNVLELTPRTQQAKIISAINSIDTLGGSTVIPGALERAGQALRALKNVDKKHIIIVSDGQVPVGEAEIYEEYARNYYETDKISISVIGVNMTRPDNYQIMEDESYSYENVPLDNSGYNKMLRLTKITHGRLHVVDKNDFSTLATQMREDLMAPEIKEIDYESFLPGVTNVTSSIFSGVQILNDEDYSNKLPFELDGFYGTKIRASANLEIVGEYNVPIYASWKYGKGTVGSIMVDLYGEQSSNMLASPDGKRLLFNIINSITPTENLRVNDIKLVLYEDNYSNTLSIYTSLDEGQRIEANIKYSTSTDDYQVSLNRKESVTDPSRLREMACYVLSDLNADNNYSRCKFIIREPGTYTIEVVKYDKDGNKIGSNTVYKSLAYSEEYDTLVDETIDYKSKLEALAKSGNGKFIEDNEDPHEIIESFSTVVYKTFDPRYVFAIVAIILFLLDIAVRKFKFKWPHELINAKKRGLK